MGSSAYCTWDVCIFIFKTYIENLFILTCSFCAGMVIFLVSIEKCNWSIWNRVKWKPRMMKKFISSQRSCLSWNGVENWLLQVMFFFLPMCSFDDFAYNIEETFNLGFLQVICKQKRLANSLELCILESGGLMVRAVQRIHRVCFCRWNL